MVASVEALGAACALGEVLGIGAVSRGRARQLGWRAVSQSMATIPKLGVGVKMLAREAWQVRMRIQLAHDLKLELWVRCLGVVRRK